MNRPRHPAGEFVPDPCLSGAARDEAIAHVAGLPALLRSAVHALDDAALDTPYINWTIRQIVHHLADSHMHALLRLKLALTTMHPTIAPYDEGATVQLADSARGPIEPAIITLEGVHARWVYLLRSMTNSDYQLAFFHPERAGSVKLAEMLGYYAWHGRHHTAQIVHLRAELGR